MRLIKLAILSFIVLFILVTIISLFIPANIRISKATNIATEDALLDTNIRNLLNWKNWHPALKAIPQEEIRGSRHRIEIRGTTMALEDRTTDEIVISMTKDKGRPVWNGFKFIKHPQSDSTTLQWYMDFKLRWYPWEKFKSLFYENIYGVQMEQGLWNLKELSKASRS